jgi:hypothetical protein
MEEDEGMYDDYPGKLSRTFLSYFVLIRFVSIARHAIGITPRNAGRLGRRNDPSGPTDTPQPWWTTHKTCYWNP